MMPDDPDEALTETLGRIPEYVATTCARPVLVLPRVSAVAEPGRRVLVAWNGSKEASSALLAAMPLLRRAGRIRIVSFHGPGDGRQPDAQEQADLGAFLVRHDVRPDILTVERGIDGGRALLALAKEGGDDLLVMGCYGHTQFREMFLGGVSRTVLQDCTIPVLMAR